LEPFLRLAVVAFTASRSKFQRSNYAIKQVRPCDAVE
jgi:hypothetical protein